MQLEVIARTPKGRARPTPLLFVHGAYGGAWEWDEHFLPYFAERGWVSHVYCAKVVRQAAASFMRPDPWPVAGRP